MAISYLTNSARILKPAPAWGTLRAGRDATHTNGGIIFDASSELAQGDGRSNPTTTPRITEVMRGVVTPGAEVEPQAPSGAPRPPQPLLNDLLFALTASTDQTTDTPMIGASGSPIANMSSRLPPSHNTAHRNWRVPKVA